jgi:hypothetical protein
MNGMKRRRTKKQKSRTARAGAPKRPASTLITLPKIVSGVKFLVPVLGLLFGTGLLREWRFPAPVVSRAPKIEFVGARDGQTFAPGDSINLAAVVTSKEVRRVDFYRNGHLLASSGN